MQVSDEKLYRLCKRYGERALMWRRKFLGLLPEVARRRLYEKKGFSSVFEFAAKLGGVSQEQVRRVLNLEKKFEDKQVLKEALVGGEVSLNKLARVASVATVENQGELLDQVKVLSNRAVETLVRDGLFEAKDEAKSVHVHRLELSDEVTAKLSELQEKGIDVNEMILEFLRQREDEIEEEKEELADKPAKSRYMPVRIKRVVRQEHGSKCAVPGCFREAKAIHHTARFSLTRTHDPNYLAPLCSEHHEIAHSLDRKFLAFRR